jgi:hypothetical protein
VQSTDEVAIWLPLAVGLGANAATIFIHSVAVTAAVRFIRLARRLHRFAIGFWPDVTLVLLVAILALVAHILEIVVWAVLFVSCGEFRAFSVALDHSAVNFTTLGYGNVIMTPRWRLLGPIEAANGMLLFGVSTALLFAVIQGIIQSRFTDLRGPR